MNHKECRRKAPGHPVLPCIDGKQESEQEERAHRQKQRHAVMPRQTVRAQQENFRTHPAKGEEKQGKREPGAALFCQSTQEQKERGKEKAVPGVRKNMKEGVVKSPACGKRRKKAIVAVTTQTDKIKQGGSGEMQSAGPAEQQQANQNTKQDGRKYHR